MVWFRVGCCERCGGVGSRGERGSGTEAAGRTVLDSIPSIASIIPKMRMMRGNGGELVHIYIYKYIYIHTLVYVFHGAPPLELLEDSSVLFSLGCLTMALLDRRSKKKHFPQNTRSDHRQSWPTNPKKRMKLTKQLDSVSWFEGSPEYLFREPGTLASFRGASKKLQSFFRNVKACAVVWEGLGENRVSSPSCGRSINSLDLKNKCGHIHKSIASS